VRFENAISYCFPLFCLILFGPKEVTADETAKVLSSEQDTSRSSFMVGVEGASLKSGSSSVTGFGPKIGFDYGISERFNVTASVSILSNGSNIVSTGISGLLNYRLFGDSPKHETVKSNGAVTVEQIVKRNQQFSVGFGFEQLFLNGTSSVYPGVGPSFGANYIFMEKSTPIDVFCRYSMLTANQASLNVVFLGVAVLFSL
jgi:hypothetical protein